jgi:hypothetical protein
LAEVPGMLTEHEEALRVDKVVQSDAVPTDEDRAMLAAKNSGLTIGPFATERPVHPKVIKILDGDDKEALNKHIKEEVLTKIEPDVDVEPYVCHTTRICGAPTQYNPSTGKDYKFYATVEEEEKMALEDPRMDDTSKEEIFAPVAHYIMMHYAEKENIEKKKRKFKSKQGLFGLEAGLKHFGDRGKAMVTKELLQFNLYDMFEPLNADKLREDDHKKALTMLIFLKEKRNGDVKARCCANGSVQ